MTTEFPTDPAAYRVEIDRARKGRGAILSIRVVLRDAPRDADILTDYDDGRSEPVADGDVDRIIRLARDEERCAPNAMPSDRAIILAAMRDAGLTPDEDA